MNVHWFASIEDAQQKIDAFRWATMSIILTDPQGSQPSGIRGKDAFNSRRLTLLVNRKREAPHGTEGLILRRSGLEGAGQPFIVYATAKGWLAGLIRLIRQARHRYLTLHNQPRSRTARHNNPQ